MLVRLVVPPAVLGMLLVNAASGAGTVPATADPPPARRRRGGSGGGRKISVNLTGESAQVIDRIRAARGLSTTQVVRRGLHLLDWFDRNSGDDVVFGISRDGGKTFREVEFVAD